MAGCVVIAVFLDSGISASLLVFKNLHIYISRL